MLLFVLHAKYIFKPGQAGVSGEKLSTSASVRLRHAAWALLKHRIIQLWSLTI